MDNDPRVELQPTNALITGLPRSGTSLATAIVDGIQNCLALSEPSDVLQLTAHSSSSTDFSQRLRNWHDETRAMLLSGGTIMDIRTEDHAPITDYVSRHGDVPSVSKPGQLVSYKGNKNSFLLASKNNALYTSTLPSLIRLKAFRIFAMIRNPLDLIASWNDVPFPISHGALPEGEKFWPELAQIPNRRLSIQEKQALIMEMIFCRYYESAAQITIVRYEDLIQQPKLYSHILSRQQTRKVSIRLRKRPPRDDRTYRNVSAILHHLAPTAMKAYEEINAQ